MALPFSFPLAFSVSLCSRSHISRSIPCASASLRSYHSIRGLRTVSFGRLNAEYVNPTAGINRVVAANSNLVLKYRLETKSVEDALALLRAWRVHEMPNVTFIDAFAGKGFLSRAALQLPNVSKVIAMEPFEDGSDPEASPLYKSLLGTKDQRLVFVPENAYHWHTWEVLKSTEHLNQVQKQPWEKESQSLFVAFQLADNIHAEKLAFQMLQVSFPKLWLYVYGRFNLGFITSKPFYERIAAKAKEEKRHKTAVLTESLVHLSPTPIKGLTPRAGSRAKVKPETFAFESIPRAEPACKSQLEYDALDFLARHIFVHKGKTLRESLPYLAHNAQVILDIGKKRGTPLPADAYPGQMTLEDWMNLTHSFLAWPFRPKDLLAPIFRVKEVDE